MFNRRAEGSSAKTSLATRTAVTAKRVCSLGAAVLVASFVSVAGANAVTASFTLNGGTGSALAANYNPNTNAATAAQMAFDGIGVGTAITIYDSSSLATNGLYVTPQNVNLTFEFMGKEAGFVNDAYLQFLGTLLFSTTDAFGTTAGAILRCWR